MKFLSLLSIMMSTLLMAHNHDTMGDATHRGYGEIFHDGDYVNFNVEFNASCYFSAADARNRVVEQVRIFEDWLRGNEASSGDIVYHIGLINISEGYSGGYNVIPVPPPYTGAPMLPPDIAMPPSFLNNVKCSQGHYASQRVMVTFNRLATARHLDNELVQGFFNELQIAIASLNLREPHDRYASFKTEINSVEKGIWQTTATQIRIAAKALAQAQATEDFLSCLGAEYRGVWHLHSVNFSDRYYSGGLASDVAMAPMPGSQMGEGPALSILKLTPIRFAVEGSFVFHFSVWEHHIPAA